MAKKKKTDRDKKTPMRIKFLIGFLVTVLVVGILGIKFFETTRGQVLLVDVGFSAYFDHVQEVVDVELSSELDRHNLLGRLTRRARPIQVGGAQRVTRLWSTSCPTQCSFVKINLALTHAAEGVGATIRGSELEGGDVLVVEVGTRKFATHRIEIRQARRRVSAPPDPKTAKRAPPVSKIALVIDDFGYSKSAVVEAFFAIDAPITIAVIPSLAYSKYAVSRAMQAGKEAILHLPMEAEELDSDVKAVETSMSPEEIARLVEKYLSAYPGLIGVNNHLGSKATQSQRVMRAVLGVVKTHDLFFLDSLTSPKSIAYTTARTHGVRTARNDIFLDDDTEETSVVAGRLRELVKIAQQKGHAVGIGHPHPWTYDAIRASMQMLKNENVELVFVSELTR